MKNQKMLVVDGVPVVLVRKKMKNIRLVVKAPRGDVFVRAPRFVLEAEVLAFVLKKLDWIKLQKDRFGQNCKRKQFVNGAQINLFGVERKVNIVETNKSKFALLQDVFLVQKCKSDDNEKLEKLFWNWAKKTLQKMLPDYFEKWSKLTGLSVSGFSVRNMQTRWGSCNPKTKKISINVQIVEKPLVCLNYLVLHEMAHIFEPSHNQNFKNFLTQFMPNWREIRKLLKK